MAESTTRNILCRFYLSNVCRDGNACRFSHDRTNGIVDNVCQFFLKSQCRYGTRCRFDHIRRTPTTGKRELVSRGKIRRDQEQRAAEAAGSSTRSDPVSYSDAVHHVTTEEAELRRLAQLPLCEYYMISGTCLDRQCRCVHGNFCETCSKYILHPHSEDANKKHVEDCTDQQRKHTALLTAMDRSAKLTCDVCLEVVLEKQPVSSRRFGILEACTHVFCIECIRQWRNVSALNAEAVRGCPTCRTTSAFVIPSVYFTDKADDKTTLIETYKNALSKIECKHFKKGRAICPFGAKCFYKHVLEDGSEPPPSYYWKLRSACAPHVLGDLLQDMYVLVDGLEGLDDFDYDDDDTLSSLPSMGSHYDSDYDPSDYDLI